MITRRFSLFLLIGLLVISGCANRVADAPPTPRPTATPESEQELIHLKQSGFGQNKRDLGFGFVVSNPNTAYSLKSSRYQMNAYDAAGNIVATEDGYIELVLPGQILGVGGRSALEEGVTVEKIAIQITGGAFEEAMSLPVFDVENVEYNATMLFPRAVGIVKNSYHQNVDTIRVNAIAFDQQGQIIGGGYTYVDFILARDQAAVAIPIISSENPDKVELYPLISGLSDFSPPNGQNGTRSVLIEAQGYGQDTNRIAFGFRVKNPNTGVIENTRYQVAAYSEDGSVLGVDSGYIDILLPDQILGVANDFSIPPESRVTSLVVQIKDGDVVDLKDTLPFSAENITYLPSAGFPKVTGFIKNPYQTGVTNLRVAALLYDRAGMIIGGGTTYVDFLPASGTLPVEIFVSGSADPARVEVYPALSGLSVFGGR